MNIQHLSGKLAVITGGSSGIGLSIAQALALKGARILIIARNPQKLAEAAAYLAAFSQTPIATLSADISNLEDIKAIGIKVAELAPCADIVVNSAGIVSAGFLADTPLTEWERLYHLNVRGLVGLLQQLSPLMRAQGLKDHKARHIVNIASAAGLFAFPGMAAYSATKAAVISLSDCLRLELASANIGVSVICPTYVKTPIAQSVQIFGRMNSPKGHKLVRDGFNKTTLTSEQVAKKTLIAINNNKGLLIIGRDGKMMDIIQRLSRRLYVKVLIKFTAAKKN